MADPKVRAFFCGSYMNLGVQREVDHVPERWEVARLGGFDIQIRPRANLIRSDRDIVYGIATTASHPELARLYAHGRDVLGAVAVLAQLPSGLWRVCLCYICPDIAPRPADDAISGGSSERRENSVSRRGTSTSWRVFSPERRLTKRYSGLACRRAAEFGRSAQRLETQQLHRKRSSFC